MSNALQFEKKIKLLKDLIKLSPTTSVFVANGLNNKSLSEKSFQLLYPDKDCVARDKYYYYLNLLPQNKELLLNIIEQETENIFSDYVHFEIKQNDVIIVRSYNKMTWIEIKANSYPDIMASRMIMYDTIDIIPLDKII